LVAVSLRRGKAAIGSKPLKETTKENRRRDVLAMRRRHSHNRTTIS
jgi:hypothetical protein